MGCEFNFDRLSAMDKAAAIAEGKAMIDQAKYDHGHSGYTGSWAECCGVEIVDCGATPPEEIEDWLDRKAEKWGPMLITECGGRWYAGALCSS